MKKTFNNVNNLLLTNKFKKFEFCDPLLKIVNSFNHSFNEVQIVKFKLFLVEPTCKYQILSDVLHRNNHLCMKLFLLFTKIIQWVIKRSNILLFADNVK